MSEPKSTRGRSTLRELARIDGSRRKPRVAFVLSGGGNLGAIQVGMLRALTDRGIVPDVILGCSVGALNGAAFALDPTEHGVDRLVEHWRGTRRGDVMPSSRIPSAVQLLRRGESLYHSDGLRAGIESLVGEGCTFEDLQIPFQCVAVDVERAIGSWFSTGELITPILASSALPAVYPLVVIEDRRYMDGGVVDNVPIGRAVELGCRTIYVLHVGTHGRPEAQIRRPLDSAMLAYWVARNSRFARDLESLPDKVEAIVLPPGKRPELKHDDFSQTDELVAQGLENSASFLDERAAESADRRISAELRAPIERLVLNARSRSWRQQAQNAAVAPEGAVLTGPSADPQSSPSAGDPSDDGNDQTGDLATIDHPAEKPSGAEQPS